MEYLLLFVLGASLGYVLRSFYISRKLDQLESRLSFVEEVIESGEEHEEECQCEGCQEDRNDLWEEENQEYKKGNFEDN